METMNLFDVKEEYDISKLKDACVKFVKEKFPRPVDDEEYQDYLQMLDDEANLEYAARLRQKAQEIEDKILKPQAETIRKVYK